MSTPPGSVLDQKQIEEAFSKMFALVRDNFPMSDPVDIAMVLLYGSAFIAYSSIPPHNNADIKKISNVFIDVGAIAFNYLSTPTTPVDATVSQSPQNGEVQGTN